MAVFTRYAIYFVPDGQLADIGSGWLGWDIVSGIAPDHLSVALPNMPKLTKAPRKYGFHATIKPPFRLLPGKDQDALENACADLCGRLSRVRIGGLHLERMGRMLALVPNGDQFGISSLAVAVVRDLDTFRAPMTDPELSTRQKPWLSPAQRQNLLDWGYPYVMDQFRFHLTLTGPLDDVEVEPVLSVLEPKLGNVVSQPLLIKSMALVGEQTDGFFRLIKRFNLTGEGNGHPA